MKTAVEKGRADEITRFKTQPNVKRCTMKIYNCVEDDEDCVGETTGEAV